MRNPIAMMTKWASDKLFHMLKTSRTEGIITRNIFKDLTLADVPSDRTPEYFYYNDPFINTVVNKNAKTLASVPVVPVIEGEDGVKHPIRGIEALDRFMDMPNEEQLMSEFIESQVLNLEIWGNVYIENTAELNEAKDIIPRAYVLRAKDVDVEKKGPSERRFKYKAEGKEVIYENSEIIHGKFIDPGDDLLGISPLFAARREAYISELVTRYNQSFMQKGARPGGILWSDKEISGPDWDRLLEEWKEQKGGWNNSGEPLFLTHGIKFQETSQTPKDMDYQLQKKESRQAVLASMNMPPVLVGLFEFANYANSLIQKRLYWEEALMPRIHILEATNTRLLRSLFEGARIKFAFDLSEVEALQEDATTKAQRDEIYSRIGAKTLNQIRMELGFEPYSKEVDPDGIADKPLVQAGLTLLEEVARPINTGFDPASFSPFEFSLGDEDQNGNGKEKRIITTSLKRSPTKGKNTPRTISPSKNQPTKTFQPVAKNNRKQSGEGSDSNRGRDSKEKSGQIQSRKASRS